jgi:hypothetical protein
VSNDEGRVCATNKQSINNAHTHLRRTAASFHGVLSPQRTQAEKAGRRSRCQRQLRHESIGRHDSLQGVCTARAQSHRAVKSLLVRLFFLSHDVKTSIRPNTSSDTLTILDEATAKFPP